MRSRGIHGRFSAGRAGVAATAAITVAMAVAAVDAPARTDASRLGDLVVRWLSDAPQYVAPGATFSTDDVVANDGGRKAGGSTIEYYLARIGRPRGVGTRDVPPLLAGAQSAEQVR